MGCLPLFLGVQHSQISPCRRPCAVALLKTKDRELRGAHMMREAHTEGFPRGARSTILAFPLAIFYNPGLCDYVCHRCVRPHTSLSGNLRGT